MLHPRFHPAPLALAVALAIVSLGTSVGHAQSAAASPMGTAFNIELAAQPLGTALNELARQAKLQLMVRPDLVAGKSAPALSGKLTARQALDRMLAGSGLTAEIDGSAVVVKPVPGEMRGSTLPSVTVTASADAPGDLPKLYAGQQVARGGRLGLLGNTDFMDAPFSMTAYTSELVENQQARSIVDVLANDPSAQAAAPRAFDNFYIRGFSIHREEIGFDGLYGISSAEGNLLEGIERVEVLKGPSTLLNGSAPRGTPGGAINLVPKRASDTPLTRVTTSYVGDGNLGSHLDLGRRFGPDNEVGIRVNAAYRDGDTAADHESERVRNLAVGLDFRGERTRLSADFGNSAQRVDGARSNFFVTSPVLPAAPSGSTNVWPAWTYQDKKHHFGVLRGEFDVSDNVTASVAYGSSTSQRKVIEAYSILTDAKGSLNATTYGLDSQTQRKSADASLRWRFATGPVKHQLVVAGTHVNSDIKESQPTIHHSFDSNLYNPVAAPSPGSDLLNQPRVQASETLMDSLALTDTLSLLNDRLRFTLGLRRQKIRAEAFHYATGVFESRYERSKTTPAAAVVFKQTDQLALYANYVEALSQGGTAPINAVNANEVFPPFVSKQGEVGVKVDGGKVATTLSAFQIRRPSGLLDAHNRYAIDGEQRNRGFEVQTFGEVLPHLRLLGGVTWTQARLNKTQGGANDGKQAAGAPEWVVKLGSEWDIPGVPGLTATGRVIHSSSQPLTVNNTIRLPGWTRFDLGARYATKIGERQVVLRGSVENVANRRYWDSVPAFQVVTYAAPRTFLLSVSVDF
ncbi:TonB-dependent receptor [Acidovorax sp. ACV01]|uniref:TonB-dependent receptor n=1 Tax=Acidovorax sp. ACV01 TaxID=2769311 RepID=UPI0017818FB1|nr:TonB-dependent receptor [Acidovorax sp. ACV01]MBD9393261.1 TonB-dependent receptor [Acidovorax sp. ACV01]